MTIREIHIDELYAPAREEVPPPFASIVCGIDGSRAGQEAARQAAVLAGPGSLITFVCVSQAKGVGASAQATITEARADEALGHAQEAAEETHTDSTARLVYGAYPGDTLLSEAEGCDLLVVGSHGVSRAGGIWLGRVASTLAHKADATVLVARRPRSEAPFPGRLLVATNGSEGSAAATRLAGAIARRHESSVIQVHVNGTTSRHAMAAEAAELRRMTGAEPVPLTETGPAHERIAAAARSEDASLVVLGSRGLRGVRALGSVSERVVHGAPCSVLVARPGLAAA